MLQLSQEVYLMLLGMPHMHNAACTVQGRCLAADATCLGGFSRTALLQERCSEWNVAQRLLLL